MRIFRKRKKNNTFDQGSQGAAEPLPDIVYLMGAQAAAAAVYGGNSQPVISYPYDAASSLGQAPGYEFSYAPIMIESENSAQEESQSSSRLQRIASAFGLVSSQSRGRSVNQSGNNPHRAGSPHQFRPYSSGTPMQYRRRAASPELVRSRPSSPYNFYQEERVPSPLHFAQQSRPGSPERARRARPVAASPELQRMNRRQRQQQEVFSNASYPVQYYPDFQQAQQLFHPGIDPNLNMQGYAMFQQPQIYSYY